MADQHTRPIEYVRELYKSKGLDACWKWAMDPKGPHSKAKRFAVLERFAEINRDRSKGEEREAWASRRKTYARQRDKFERRYEERKDVQWPASVTFTELLYHNPPHLHVACADREKLIALAKIGRERFGLRIGEFPPFDPVEDVHVHGSWHYRDSSSPWTPRTFSNRGNGLAFDANDLDGGNDQEYAFYLELRRRYG